ncbi:PadR family transcriptional regulator [Nocardia arthritidis]|uniref:PadR family transcriptional regulator n=1 Tax=Nocardia arthritidis TaxID=228602 RepID=A0A6G9Y8F4_9NOCA|nr:PadR family transcriptional regulator [Nocardia arthritidis]QIS09458.1 PadR family transcriptional regulator [Nocardia arthritidis]
MAKKRKVNNLMALAVLGVVIMRPMHRYEIATMLKAFGKDRDMGVKWGSLYTVVDNLRKAGFLEIVGSERAGARPERTIYQITEAGRAELFDWTREVIAEPEPEQLRFVAGLSLLSTIPPDDVIDLLGSRIEALRRAIEAETAEVDQLLRDDLPRLFLVENQYRIAMLEAEANWAEALRKELVDGSFPGVDQWRQFHVDGLPPPEVIQQAERSFAAERDSS